MRLFLLWQPKDGSDRQDQPETVASNLLEHFGGLFTTPPEVRIRSERHASLVTLELPVAGFNAPFFEEDDETWAFAVEYPWNLRSVLSAQGLDVPVGRRLTSLARLLEERPESLLAELAPPFSLIWCKKATGEVFFQNDGLGQAQTFVFEDDSQLALTNRLPAFQALGLPLEPVAEAWATRFTLGWFPLDESGYRNAHYVPPGTCFKMGAKGPREERTNVLTSWVQPEPMQPDECLELARASMQALARDATELWDEPSVGLSGGWDSRMVLSCLRSVGSDFTLRVRGNPERFDVMIASELARIADLHIRFKTKGGWPADDVEGCRRSILRSLRWQGGYMATKKHKGFLGRKQGLEGGTINVMGQHGGLGKADFSVKIGALDLPAARHEDELVAKLMHGAHAFLRDDRREHVAETIRRAHRAADEHGLEGLARLHFFFLNEYTRRWGSAAINAQTGMIFAPILNPGTIRAAYAFPQEELHTKPFHRFVTSTLAPEWAKIPYTDETTREELEALGIFPPKLKKKKIEEIYEGDTWKRPRNFAKFSSRRYWRNVAFPLIDEALDAGGFWTEIFDPDLVRSGSRENGDALAIAHLLPNA